MIKVNCTKYAILRMTDEKILADYETKSMSIGKQTLFLMFIHNKSILTFVIFFTLGCLGARISYASANYSFSIRNNLPVKSTMTVKEAGKDCINSISGLPMSVDNNTTRTFSFEDSNYFFGGCTNENKTLGLDILVDVGESHYSVHIEFHHDKLGSWATKIISTNANVLALSKATCNTQDCLDKYASGSGDMSLAATIGLTDQPGAFYFKSIGLGDVKVTDGYGLITPIAPITGKIALAYDKTYIISFTKTSKQCKVLTGLINCPTSIGFSNKLDTIVFACQQGNKNDPSCPWTLTKNNDNAQLQIY